MYWIFIEYRLDGSPTIVTFKYCCDQRSFLFQSRIRIQIRISFDAAKICFLARRKFTEPFLENCENKNIFREINYLLRGQRLDDNYLLFNNEQKTSKFVAQMILSLEGEWIGSIRNISTSCYQMATFILCHLPTQRLHSHLISIMNIWEQTENHEQYEKQNEEITK